jgi:NADP-dependent 3-hydroxy acid dehydrogenase YdfG
MEVKPYNIRTTIVCPGAVKTELFEHITEADVQKANKDYIGAVGIVPTVLHVSLLLQSASRRM